MFCRIIKARYCAWLVRLRYPVAARTVVMMILIFLVLMLMLVLVVVVTESAAHAGTHAESALELYIEMRSRLLGFADDPLRSSG